MKPILLLITLTVFLAACAAPPAELPTASPNISAEGTRTRRPSQTPGPTKTLIPSHTPRPSEAATLLPTIPTFTPTFDVRTIVTATPAPKAECPVENPNIHPDLLLDEMAACENAEINSNGNPLTCINREMGNQIFDYLNKGAPISSIISQLKADGQKENVTFFYKDLNDDLIPDFVFKDPHNPYGGFYFYTCNNSAYKVQTLWDGDPYAAWIKIAPMKDLNRNGISEIVVTAIDVLLVLEWNGDIFEEILRIDGDGSSEFTIKNIDKDSMQEIILYRDDPFRGIMSAEFPWRHYVSTYKWNGISYVRDSQIFDAPVYRFQAIQDGDRYLLQGNYQKAMELYQDTIFSNELGWWSPEKRNYEFAIYNTPSDEKGNSTPFSTPETDLTEYPRLAAYAYYRMVILHTFLGETEAAQVKYATLQEKFPAGSPGHPYVEMATDFWNAYQSGGRMYDACAAAIAYADAHPGILVPLGSDYHGAQSHTYTPADVCPFR
jgi:hypothetical protein